MLITARRVVLCALLAGTSSCAADTPSQSVDGADGPSFDGGFDEQASDQSNDADVGDDMAPGLLRDAAPQDAGAKQTEPPLTIPTCDGVSDGTCCRSALGFEDGTTEHFLPPTCCKLALSNPEPVTMPTACGRGALRLDAAFQATTDASLCGTANEAPACVYRTGEVSRAVLTSLDVSGLTMSAAINLDGPPLPSGMVYGQLFILGKNGLVDGPQQAIKATSVWTAIEFPVPNDGSGADIRLIGVRIGFEGQAWVGQAYLDEISWH